MLILGAAEFEVGTLVLMANNYITIIGVLLATIWASGSQWKEEAEVRWMAKRATRAERGIQTGGSKVRGHLLGHECTLTLH